MKTKYVIIAIVVALAVGGVLLYLRRKGKTVVLDESGAACVKVPATFKKWTGDFSAMDSWYDQAREQYLEQAFDDAAGAARVAGFFKAIGVEPRGDYVKYYKDTLKTWLAGTESRPHWEVETAGELACVN